MFNGDYLSIPLGTGSCGYLFHEIPGIIMYAHYPTINPPQKIPLKSKYQNIKIAGQAQKN